MIGAAHQTSVGDQIKDKMGGGGMWQGYSVVVGWRQLATPRQWWWGEDSLAHLDSGGGVETIWRT
jgi:hypothetical protein